MSTSNSDIDLENETPLSINVTKLKEELAAAREERDNWRRTSEFNRQGAQESIARIVELEAELTATRGEVTHLKMELDASCNAEELRQVRIERDFADAACENLRAELAAAQETITRLRMDKGHIDLVEVRENERLKKELAAAQEEYKKLRELRDRVIGGVYGERFGENERLRLELSAALAIASTCCDSPEDRMYHAADKTWWRRTGDRWVAAEPPTS